MLPAALLVYRIQADRVVPAFLGEADHPWIRAVIDERVAFVGRPRRELAARRREPLGVAAPPRRRALVAHVLDRLATPPRRATTAPRELRATVFAAAAAAAPPRAAIVAEVAGRLGVSPGAIDDELFADLPGEQPVAPLPGAVDPVALAARANLALARGLLTRADRVRIELDGNALPVVRRAKLRGLIVTVARRPGGGAILDVSGPLALFHHTRVYGRALGDLVPLLAWAREFRLEATCALPEGRHVLQLATGDRIFPGDEPRRHDSSLEERFAAAMRRDAPDWDLVRDPQPLVAGPALVFPDFALVRRGDPSCRWLIEIVGFWTPAYLRAKLDAYRRAGAPELVLCIDERRRCAAGELPPGARVVWFRRRIDPAAVLHAVEAGGAPAVDEALLDAVRRAAAGSRYGNAFVSTIERAARRRVSVAELRALGRAGRVALNRPTNAIAVRPLDPPRLPIPAEPDAVREHIRAAIDGVRRDGLPLLYHLVRERFDWLGEDGRDRLRPIVDALAADGLVRLREVRGRAWIDEGTAGGTRRGDD